MSKQTVSNTTPSGNDFMKGTSLDFLRKQYKKEKDAKAKIRLAAAILRKQEKSYTEITENLNVLRSTLSYWLQRMDADGVAGAYHREHPGRECFLSESQLAQLKTELVQNPQKFGFAQSMWSTRMIIDHVKKRYGRQYVARGMTDLLHRIGFSVKKPRITHYRSASESEKKQFKKKQGGPLQDTQNVDMPRSVWTSQHM